jgi:hypothetical protein
MLSYVVRTQRALARSGVARGSDNQEGEEGERAACARSGVAGGSLSARMTADPRAAPRGGELEKAARRRRKGRLPGWRLGLDARSWGGDPPRTPSMPFSRPLASSARACCHAPLPALAPRGLRQRAAGQACARLPPPRPLCVHGAIARGAPSLPHPPRPAAAPFSLLRWCCSSCRAATRRAATSSTWAATRLRTKTSSRTAGQRTCGARRAGQGSRRLGFMRACALTALPAARFHVDRLSSAHVYMRLAKGETVANISKEARRLERKALATTR